MKAELRALGLFFTLVLLLSSCALIGGFNARSHEHLTALKAAHLKFIDTFTEGKDRAFSVQKLSDESDKIDLKFREALEFSHSLDDKFRTSNLADLRSIYQEDLDLIRSKNRLLKAEEAKTLSDSTGRGYDAALRGECARPNANCKSK